MKKRTQGWLWMPLVITLLLVLVASAQPQFPKLNGAVADTTGKLDAATIQAAADALARITGAKPIALAYNHKDGISSDDFEKQFLEKSGFGNPDKKNLDPNVVMIAIDYESRSLNIWYGDAFLGPLDRSSRTIRDDNVAPYAASDPTRAFTSGFDAIAKVVEAYRNPPKPVVQAPQVVEVHKTEVDTKGVGSAFWKIFLVILGVVLLGALVLFMVKVAWPWYAKRKQLFEKIDGERKKSTSSNLELARLLPTNPNENSSVAQLLLIFSKERPDDAEAINKAYLEKRETLLSIQKRSVKLDHLPLSITSDPATMNQALAEYQRLEGERTTIRDWLCNIDLQAEELRKALAEVPVKIMAVSKRLATALSEYQTTTEQSPHFYHSSQAGIQKLQAMLADIETKAKNSMPFSALQLIAGLDDQIGKFTKAHQALFKIEGDVKTAQTRIRTNWESSNKIVNNPEKAFAVVDRKLVEGVNIFAAGDYDAAIECASKVEESILALEQVMKRYIEVEDLTNKQYSTILDLQREGYQLQAIQDDAKAILRHSDLANQALDEGDFDKAADIVEEIDTDSKRALDAAETLKRIKIGVDSRLAQLSQKVAIASKKLTEEITPLWQALQKFHQANWGNVSECFAQAEKLLQSCFDNPNDPNDLASKIAQLNDFKHQKFEEAEHLMTRAETDLGQAVLLMDQLEAQHRKVIDAKASHKEALAQAKTAISQAKAIRDADDRLIDEAIDKAIRQAEENLKAAERSAEDEIYVDVMGYCQNVRGFCDQAVSGSRNQVANIQALIAKKDANKSNAHSSLKNVQARIEEVTRAALGDEVFSLLSSAAKKINEAGSAETKALALEDRKMASLIDASANLYAEAIRLIDNAKDQLNRDIENYEALLNQAKTAIRDAENAISTARHDCNDHRAGSSGDSSLARAERILPAVPQYGAAIEAINRVISAAKEANDEADKASNSARYAINAYIEREREEREERERAERAREAEERRIREAARRSYDSDWGHSSSGSSGRSSFGGGGSSGRISIGGGGSSGRTGF